MKQQSTPRRQIMKRLRTNPAVIPHARRGLAPLEFVLSLPLLVMMMALMIDFGVAGAWKIRTQTNARYAGWRTLTSRTGEFNATPPYWPASAPLAARSGTPLPDVSDEWDATTDLLCPCARGQQLTAPSAVAAINRLKQTKPKSIKFLCLLACPEGIQTMRDAHPDVHIYTAAIDRQLNENGYILPGLGDAGDRIFGTK